MSRTCAIYVPQNQLAVEEKIIIFRDIHGANYLFENWVALSIPYILPPIYTNESLENLRTRNGWCEEKNIL